MPSFVGSASCGRFRAHPLLALFCTAASATGLFAQPTSQPTIKPTPSGGQILQDLKAFANLGSVLHVAAHPDDENTQLLTYLSRGRAYRTAYLSLTRGDGGQNVIGPEFGAALGLIRTHELLAARKIDGAQQLFTRAQDFGYSKSADETMRVWNRHEVLGDIVRIYRQFRPDVIITRFNPDTGGTHGHHTASAILAREAFKLSADPAAYPEQLQQGLTVWQPKRILLNGRGANADLQIDVSGKDPITGETFAVIAARSRAQHKSQGFTFNPGGNRGEGPRIETFQLLAGEPATKDPFDGIDTTWSRIAGGEPIAKLTSEVLAKFEPQNPEASVPALIQIRKAIGGLPPDPLVSQKLRELDRLIGDCLGVTLAATVDRAEISPGETVQLTQKITARSNVPIHFGNAHGIEYSIWGGGSRQTPPSAVAIPPATPLSQPYWLRASGSDGLSRVDDPLLIGLPVNSPAIPAESRFEVSGQQITIYSEPRDPTGRTVEIIPKVSLHPTADVRLFAPSSSRTVDIEIFAARPNSAGTLSLQAPANWKVEPAQHAFTLPTAGASAKLTFTVTAPPAPAAPTSATFQAIATVDGQQITTGRQPINYPHIPPLLLQPKAEVKAVVLDVATKAKTVAYLPGAGDDTVAALTELGCAVTTLKPEDLTPDKLKTFDAVVLGVRALNVRSDLATALPALTTYANEGGTLLIQYNRPNDLKATLPPPFDLRPTGARITDETAPPTFLASGHKALTTPNKITEADFQNWTQERGIYFPSTWSKEFTPLLAFADPGEQPQNGALLIAPHGKGHIVYTSLVFFRQLPAANPGAYRLFANLISLGKP